MNLHPGARVIDATLGLGGHAMMILKQIGTNGQLTGFDRDAQNLDLARQQLATYEAQITFINDSFGNMSAHDLQPVDAILFDLGFSSVHVDDASRGFSFLREGPLDMRYDKAQELTAETIVNGWSKDELAELFRVFGEEPRAREIAAAICKGRKKQRIVTTTQFADLVEMVVKRRGRIHPATRVFQALRIVTNDEFGEIKKGLTSAVNLLKPGGRLVVITFHSLEDRIVKQFLKESEGLAVLTKKAIKPTHNEIQSNPRSRSALVRIAEKG